MRKRVQRTGAGAETPPCVRVSITFPSDLYEILDEIAHEKKVSHAWVVRDAAGRYVQSCSQVAKERIPRF